MNTNKGLEKEKMSAKIVSKGVPTLEEFSNAVTFNDFPPPRAEQYQFFTAFLQPIGKISSKCEAAMILAHMIHESDGLTEKEERGKSHQDSQQDSVDKDEKFPNQRFHGRGYLRLKHSSNYQEVGAYLNLGDELVENPERIVKEEELSWKSAFALWAIKVHPNVDVQAGHFGASICALGSLGSNENPAEIEDESSRERWEIYQNVHRAFNLDPSDCQFD